MRRLLAGIYFWVTGFWVTAFFFVMCGLSYYLDLLTIRRRDGRWVHANASRWGRTIIRMMPGWRVTVTGETNLLPDGQASVIVANHESMSDIWAMYYLGVQFRWLSKISVFKWPMIGIAMRWAGYVPVDRSKRESGAEAMRESANRLALGLSMFFFPEGTRSLDGRIKEFKLGAFKLAQSSGVPVQPIAIHGAGDLMRKGSAFPNPKAHVQIKVLPSLPAPRQDEDLTAYAEIVRGRLIAAHAELLRIERDDAAAQSSG